MTQGRIERLQNGPVLRTLRGCLARIKHLSVADLFLLTTHYDCRVKALERKLWTGRRPRKDGS